MPLSQVLTLTNRDLSILVFTWSFGGVTADLICKRHFHAGPGVLRACYRRIARLIGQGLLTCTRLPSSTSVGSGKAFPTLGKAARPILTEALGFSSSAELGRIRMAGPGFGLGLLSESRLPPHIPMRNPEARGLTRNQIFLVK